MSTPIVHSNIPYPDFQVGEVIDEAQFDANNAELQDKINEVVDKANEIDVTIDGHETRMDAVEVQADATTIVADAADVKSDAAVITADEADAKADIAIIDSDAALTKATQVEGDYLELKPSLEEARDLAVDASTGGLDDRYVTRSEAQLDNNIDIIYEVFTIVNADNGDDTFTYEDADAVQHVGTLSEGYQIFTLQKGDYTLDENRISAYVNDTLHRSKGSGGLLEVDSNNVGITAEGNGAEITIKYMTISGSLGAGIVIGFIEPLHKYIGKVWLDTSGGE